MDPLCSIGMKGRPFLAALLVVALATLGLGGGGWWLVWQRGPLQLQHHMLAVPRAARFVPKQAPLSLYLFTDGEQPVDYARAVAPLRQRQAASKAVERLRDGAFAAAGLDYHDELAAWLAPDIALSVFDPPDPNGGGSWLLALSSRDGEGARRFLQRFWQSRSLAGSGLQVSQYRGMGLISGRGALVGREPVPLATALVQDDLVLIASGRATLERALDVSQIDALNQAGLTRLREGVAELGEGVALLVARSAAFEPWLGLPSLEPSAAGDAAPLLLGAVQPRGSELELKGLLRLKDDPSLLAAAGADRPADGTVPAPAPPEGFSRTPGGGVEPDLPQGLGGDSTSLAILRDPAGLLRLPWLQAFVQRITSPPSGGPLPPLLAAADQGVLLLSQSPQGWVMGTSRLMPRPDALEPALAAEGLIDAPLEVEGETITVWTRLRAISGQPGRQGAEDQLRASVAGWRREAGEWAWWGNNLALLQDKPASGGLLERQRQLARLNWPDASLRWVLGGDAASELVRTWTPWKLLTTLAGGPLSQGLGSLSVGLDVPEPSTLRWSAKMHFNAPTHG
jgi:hypothetical protein